MKVVSQTAGTEYYAGVVQGWIGVDVLQNMRVCMPADKYLAQLIDADMNAIVAQDWETMNYVTQRMNYYFNEDLEKCKDDQAVIDVFTKVTKLEADFTAQDNWQKVLQYNVQTSESEMSGLSAQMTTAWYAGNYYNAGILSGKISGLLYKKPETYSTFLN